MSSLTTDTPGVRHGKLILIDRAEVCPLLLDETGQPTICDGIYDLIESHGEAFTDDFETHVREVRNAAIGYIREYCDIRYAVCLLPTTDNELLCTSYGVRP